MQHLNALFPHPSTLKGVSKLSKTFDVYECDIDRYIAELVQRQYDLDTKSAQQIQRTKVDLAELFQNVEAVRQKAVETEDAITKMTADIKRLDNTKRNLTLSMTALKRLQMLTTAYEQLRDMSTAKQYKECTQLLQAVVQLMSYFRSYRSIDQIAALSKNVSILQKDMLEQVCTDFEVCFAKGEVTQRRSMLAEACQVMDALGESARSRLIVWYCNTQLREYRQLFRRSEEAGSLENISMRYSWFKRMLKTYDEEHAAIFPPSWRVNEMLANAFCEGTRDDFRDVLQKVARRNDGQTLDVDQLLKCLQETLDFEHGLDKKFTNVSRASTDTMSSSEEKMLPVFGQTISEAFEPYLSIWVDAQDRQLAATIPKYRTEPARRPDEEFFPQMVVTSSTTLFNFYRLTLSQCAKLSKGHRLVELTKVFAKYLDQYAQQVLLYYITERPSGQTPSRIPHVEDLILVLNTADYCYNTSIQLEEKIKSRIEPDLRSQVDLQSQADAFMGVASASVRALVRYVEKDIESSFREMRNVSWSKMEKTGDESLYITEMLAKIRCRATEILGMLYKQQYARAFCDNVTEITANSYLANVFLCKPISEAGAEQMLLDTYSLKTVFELLLTRSTSTEPTVPPPANYTKRVSQSMARINSILKTLQVRPSPPEALVQAYLIHIADKSDANFRKILDLKGLNRKDQANLLEIFQAHQASPAQQSLQQSNPILNCFATGTGINGVGVNVVPGIVSLTSGASLGTTHLPARLDPANLGTAIMTAARDGVDRFGTPSLKIMNTTQPESRVTSPPPPQTRRAMSPEAGASTNLNDNLRNIGRFFKRDIAGFGGRFGVNTRGEDR